MKQSETTNKQILLGDLRVIFNLFNASSEDPTRPNMHGVYHYKDQIFATNGHIAAKKCTYNLGNYFFGLESKEILKSFLKDYKKSAYDLKFDVVSKGEQLMIESSLCKGKSYYFTSADEKIAEKYFNQIPWEVKSEERTQVIGINPYLLVKIQKAMGLNDTFGLELLITKSLGPIIVKPNVSDKNIDLYYDFTAVIMPMKTLKVERFLDKGLNSTENKREIHV